VIAFNSIPFQCREKLPENGERDEQKIELDKEKSKVFDFVEINCICSSLGELEL
jgi:hypothetical protein